MKKKAVIVDYGLGNIFSAQQSFLKVAYDSGLEISVKTTNKPSDVMNADFIVLPGQGAFSSCMMGLKEIPGMIKALEDSVLKNKKPFLGICVGMQLLANIGYENGNYPGLGWIDGAVKKIEVKNLKLPHMGWNSVKLTNKSKIFNFNQENKDFYFVHSYYFDCLDKKNVVGLTNYGFDFASIVAKENIYGVQFHPEKSSDQGLGLIKDFLFYDINS